MTEAEKQAMFDACFTYDDHSATGGNSEYRTRNWHPYTMFLQEMVVQFPTTALCVTVSRAGGHAGDA